MTLLKKAMITTLLTSAIGSATLCMDTHTSRHTPSSIEKQMIKELEDRELARWFDRNCNIETVGEEAKGGYFASTREDHLDSDQAYSSEEESDKRSSRPAEYSYSEATPHAHESNVRNEGNSFLVQCASWMFTCAGESTSYVSRCFHAVERFNQHYLHAHVASALSRYKRHESSALSCGYERHEVAEYLRDLADLQDDY